MIVQEEFKRFFWATSTVRIAIILFNRHMINFFEQKTSIYLNKKFIRSWKRFIKLYLVYSQKINRDHTVLETTSSMSHFFHWYRYIFFVMQTCFYWGRHKHSTMGRAGSWWRHQMETFSALLAICAWNSPVPGEFPTQRPVTRSFDVYFDLRPNKRLSKQS